MPLAPLEVCAQCRSAEVWARAEGEPAIVITHDDVDAALRRRRGERPRPPLVAAVAAAASVALAAAAVLALARLGRALPIGPLDELVATQLAQTRAATLLGGGALLVAVLSLWRVRRGRSFRRWPLLVPNLAAIVAATVATIVGGVQWWGSGPVAFQYLRMPPRDEAVVPSPHYERIAAATAVILAPDRDGDARGVAAGTGAIIARDAKSAWIVTCSHVAMPYAAVGAFRRAAEARPVWVQLSDGSAALSTVRWAAPPPLDVALIQAPIAGAPQPVDISPGTEELAMGKEVMFVPNPYRDGWRLHRGTVVSRDRHHTPSGVFDLVVTNLPVQPGDSGSGLFDERGLLVGLNTWLARTEGGAVGISLPSEALRAIVDAIARDQLDALDDVMQRSLP